jgi:hypothetical protein
VRRILTWLLVGAVVALGVAAGLDALRGGDDPEPAAEAAEPPPPTVIRAASGPGLEAAASTLRAAGLSGGLTYADEDCAVHALTLPDLASIPVGDLSPRPEQVGSSCKLVPPQPRGVPYRIRCRHGRVEVTNASGKILARYEGCAPVWGPGEGFGLVRDGGVVKLAGPVAAPGYAYERVVLSRARVERELRAAWSGYRFAVTEFIWLGGNRLAAVVEARKRRETVELLAVFAHGRLLSMPGYGYDGLTDLRTSPNGSFVTARIVEPGGLAVVDRNGETARPALRHGDAIAWSYDERWIAEATPDGIYVFRADESSPVFVNIPVVARDLTWW